MGAYEMNDHVGTLASIGVFAASIGVVRRLLDHIIEHRLGLFSVLLVQILLTHGYDWLCSTFPMPPGYLNALPCNPNSQELMAGTVGIATVLAMAQLMTDDDCGILNASACSVLNAAGLYLFPYFTYYGLGFVACLIAILASCYSCATCVNACRMRREVTAAKFCRWSLVSVCACACASVALGATGWLPYASGNRRIVPDQQRKLAANMAVIESLAALDDWDVGCADGVKMLQTVAMIESRYLDIPPGEEPVVELATIPSPSVIAYYDHSMNTIVVSPHALSSKEGSRGYVAIHTICHEIAHAWQYRAMKDPSILEDTRMPIDVDEARLRRWASEFASYENGRDGNTEAYASQDCEQFADEFADAAVVDYWRRLNEA